MTVLTISTAPVARRRAAAMPHRRGLGQLAVHAVLFLLVALWTIPALGVFLSSLRDKEQLSVSGWWTSFADANSTEAARLPEVSAAELRDGAYVIAGQLFDAGAGKSVARYGLSSDEP